MTINTYTGKRHTFSDVYHERTSFAFIPHTRRWFILSGILLLISVVSLFARGLNLGIDFTGGTSWQVNQANVAPDVGDVRDAVADAGVDNAEVTILGDRGIRVIGPELTNDEISAVTDAVAAYAEVERADVTVNQVGPTWGEDVTRQALIALGVFFLLVAVYLSIRFEWKMAAAALVAVVHDIVITVGVYSVFQFELVPATVTAVLTILGFSLYDTVVVFDKVKEHQVELGVRANETYSEMVNRSLNEVLMRSLSTSVIAVLPVLSLLLVGSLLLGALTLRDFGIALFVGLFIGAYSSLFIAAPLLAWWKEREPRYRALRERLERTGPGRARPGGPAAGGPATDGPTPAKRVKRAPAAVPVAVADPDDAPEAVLADGEIAPVEPVRPASIEGPPPELEEAVRAKRPTIAPRPCQPRRRKRR